MPKKGNTWVVQGGDNLSKIARDVYGAENERMFAQIVKLNGGVKNIRPGMVLRLPKLQNNDSIFISNDWATNMGMATVPQLQEFYNANPGQSATSAMRSGVLQPAGALGAPTPPPAIKPFVNTNTAAPFQTPYGMQQNTVQMRPNGTDRTKDDLSTFSPQQSRGMITAPIAVGTPFNPEPNYFNSGAANFGIVQSRPAPVAQAAAAAQVRPIGQTWEQQQRQRGLTAANPSDINNVLTGQLPAGATVSGSQPPPAAKPNAPTQKGSFGTQTVVTPAQAFNYPDEIRPTPLNQSQETLSYVAPYVQEALQMLDNTLNAPAGLGSINKSQVDLLVQAGLLFDEADIAIAYDLAAGGDPSKYRTTPGGTPAADSTGGEWQPFATPPGGKFIMPEQMGGGKRGRSGAQTNAGRLSQWAGSGAGGFGPSLGLTQWRMNL